MVENSSKLSAALSTSNEILNNIENDDLGFEQVLLKCLKLARLRDDFDSINWFTAELHGYDKNNELPNISINDLERYAVKSGRMTVSVDPVSKDENRNYWTASVSEIEIEIQTLLTTMESLKPPSQFTPSVNKRAFETSLMGAQSSETVVEKYQDILSNIRLKQLELSGQIKHLRSLLSKIRNGIYSYVLNINLQLRFESVTESIFQETKVEVDKKLTEICPDAIRKFIAAYNRIDSTNPEEWSQAMSSCRNVLKEFADYVFPAADQPFKKRNGEQIVVTDDKYKNRIIAFLEIELTGDKGKWMSSRLSDLETRIHSLNDLLSKGTHVGIELTDVRMCVLDTYLFIGSIISLVK